MKRAERKREEQSSQKIKESKDTKKGKEQETGRGRSGE